MRRFMRSRWLRALGWVLAGTIAIGALLSMWDVQYDEGLRAHPIATEGTVTDVYINGFGGDPTVDYRYRVGDQTFTGSGNAQLNQGGALAQKNGDNVYIKYATAKPWVSCTCNPAVESGLWGLVLVLPLAFLIFATVWDRRHPEVPPVALSQ
jgi:hypothetical protein